jgi:uncharacterized protein (UPF0548 family)
VSFSFRAPSTDRLQSFVAKARETEPAYSSVGATATHPPAAFRVDHTRVQLGRGDVFQPARHILGTWEHMNLGWLTIPGSPPPIVTGETVPILCQAYGLWCLNACRIVYTIDGIHHSTIGRLMRYGFAYGTLPSHVESGEERFLVEHDLDDDTVWFDILAFSRPRHPLARLAYPLARRMQKRFARESAQRI